MTPIKIGIDPDVHKSGIATRVSGHKKMLLQLLTFFEMFAYLNEILENDSPDDIHIYIEAGWLNNKSNFHSHAKQSKVVGERIAKNVGANHETGKKIVEMCEYLGIKYTLCKPQTAKMKPEIFERITGIKTRNQELIDAAVLIL